MRMKLRIKFQNEIEKDCSVSENYDNCENTEKEENSTIIRIIIMIITIIKMTITLQQ